MTRTPALAVAAALVAAPFATGCAENCPTARDSLNGRVWSLFGHAATWEPEDLTGYPAGTSPVNGDHEYAFDWATGAPDGEVAVTIDGQVFEGTGRWSETECGNFSVGFDGLFEARGDVHAFSASALLVTYDNHLDGFVDWQETWQSAAGGVGSFTADIRVTTIEPF